MSGLNSVSENFNQFYTEWMRLDGIATGEENAVEGIVPTDENGRATGAPKDFDMYIQPIEDLKNNWNAGEGVCGKIRAVVWIAAKHVFLGPIYSTFKCIFVALRILWQLTVELAQAVYRSFDHGSIQPMKTWGHELFILAKSCARNYIRAYSVYGALAAKVADIVAVKLSELAKDLYVELTSSENDQSVVQGIPVGKAKTV